MKNKDNEQVGVVLVWGVKCVDSAPEVFSVFEILKQHKNKVLIGLLADFANS